MRTLRATGDRPYKGFGYEVVAEMGQGFTQAPSVFCFAKSTSLPEGGLGAEGAGKKKLYLFCKKGLTNETVRAMIVVCFSMVKR